MAEKLIKAKHYALNLGCGNDYRKSDENVKWLNVDKGECKVDLELDIEQTPFKPYRNENFEEYYDAVFGKMHENMFDSIHAIQVLEHIEKSNFVSIIRELYRISKDGCIWNIQVPHAFSDNFITDPTHKMPYSTRTFDYFCEETVLRENGIIYGWGDIKLRHAEQPQIDNNHSIIFTLIVKK